MMVMILTKGGSRKVSGKKRRNYLKRVGLASVRKAKRDASGDEPKITILNYSAKKKTEP